MECVVLGHRDDGWAGFQWSGEEPEGMFEPEEAEEAGAKWEGDELVTCDLVALRRNYAASDEEWLPDSD
ncbi:MAG: hypothetical protein M3N68_13965 [Actinomycetota bacterium]|nr:hypothetical protein [Actinomycetota bacterium]